MKAATKKLLTDKKIISGFVTTVVLFVLLVLALIIQLNPALGWFSLNKEVRAGRMENKIFEPDDVSIREYRVYKRNFDSDGVEEVSNNVENDPLYLAQFSMNEYDTILTEHNENTHVVIRVLIDNVNTDRNGLSILFTTNQPIAQGDETEPLD